MGFEELKIYTEGDEVVVDCEDTRQRDRKELFGNNPIYEFLKPLQVGNLCVESFVA